MRRIDIACMLFGIMRGCTGAPGHGCRSELGACSTAVTWPHIGLKPTSIYGHRHHWKSKAADSLAILNNIVRHQQKATEQTF
jgi:hypothetical protein